MSVLSAQTELAHRQAELRQRQLVAEVVKPAEAEAEKVRVLAEADAQRTRMQAEAAASNNRVALDRMLIEQLPQIVKEAASGPGRGQRQRAERRRRSRRDRGWPGQPGADDPGVGEEGPGGAGGENASAFNAAADGQPSGPAALNSGSQQSSRQ